MPDLADQLSDPDQNVVLTGFMGTGKTATGRHLARRLGFAFVDTDRLIEDRHGPITEIFNRHGESRFREIEREVAAAVAGRNRQVVATGGAMLLDAANESVLGGSGRVICLTATPRQILDRVLSSRSPVSRPLLAGPDPAARIRSLLAERGPGYRRFPQIRTDGTASDVVAAEAAEVIATKPSVAIAGARPTVVGIGIAARARLLFDGLDVTVVDVGRIQPPRGLRGAELVAIQGTVAAVLGRL